MWSAFGAVYYFIVHERILRALEWLSENLAFSFGIGSFFGIFTIDVAHSANLVMKLKQYAKEHDVIVKYENIKAHIRAKQKRIPGKYHFFRPFHSSVPLIEQLSEMYGSNGKAKNGRKGSPFNRKN